MFDLGATPDEDLSTQAFLRFGLAVLKLARGSPDVAGRLLTLATEEVYRDDRVLALLRYVAEVYAELDRTTMEALIAPLANEEHSQMTTLLQRLFAEGKAEGWPKVESKRSGKAKRTVCGKAKPTRCFSSLSRSSDRCHRICWKRSRMPISPPSKAGCGGASWQPAWTK